MNYSPLILKNYFVTSLSVRTNTNLANVPPIETHSGELSTKVQTAKTEDGRMWKVSLAISVRESGDKFCPYFVDAELVGFFEAHKDLPHEKIEDVVTANAPALLYSAARELILLITGRGPLPPFSLPCATFIDETPSSRKKAATGKSPERELSHK